MLSLKQLILIASLSVLAVGGPLERRQDNTGCMFFLDLVNDCGQMYGGSWDICKSPTTTFDIPDCNGETCKKKVCEYYLNECKKRYGGCYDKGDPVPVWENPSCP